MRKRLLILLAVVAVLVVIGVRYGQTILLNVFQAAAPLDQGDYHWEKIVAQPGSLDLPIRGHGVRHIEFEPSCSNRPGTNPEFSFYVREGQSDKLLILFSGGGACWSGQNCIPGDGSSGLKLDGRVSYVDEIFPQIWGALQYSSRGRYGMLDHTDPENPIRDWDAVWIFSCDGSVFWGSNDQEYTDPFYGGGTHVIRHRGFDNTMAVLAYLKERWPNPPQVLVSGQSAGGYGSALLFPYFREAYPDARVDLLVDSATGIVPRIDRGDDYDFLKLAIPLWQAQRNAPDWIGIPTDLDGFTSLDLEDIFAAVARYYPDSRVAEYTPAWDLGQVFIWHLMNTYTDKDANWNASIYKEKQFDAIPDATFCDWNQRLLQRRGELLQEMEGENYTLYLAPGAHHGIGNDFAGSSAGVPFRAWLTELVSDAPMPTPVFCDGDCGRPEAVMCN